jgi:hypothetical protein
MAVAPKKIKLSKRTTDLAGKKSAWNEQLSLGLFALGLLICTGFLVWEDVSYREKRTQFLKEAEGLLEKEMQKTKASADRSLKDDYRQTLKSASSYLKQYQRNPSNAHNLILAQGQLKMALLQCGNDPVNENASLKIQQRLDTVNEKIKALGLADSLEDVEAGDEAREVSSGNAEVTP